MSNEAFSVAIVGAGFSGAMLAVQLLRRCRDGDRVYLIERRAGFGRGLAYSTSNHNHLLNVRAGNMSAFQDEPGHFVAWLRRHHPDTTGAVPDADSFVSRHLYGSYIRRVLGEALWSGGKGRNLFLVPDQAVSVHADARGASLTVAGGACYRVDAVVLAAGNLPPDETRGAYVGDPWAPGAVEGIPKDRPVLLVGTGLTMVDTVQTLLDGGHRGTIHAVSRRGLLPHVHAPTRPLALAAADLPRTTSVARLARWMRSSVRAAETEGRDWRDVMDGLRPHLQDLWRRLPPDERRRFVRHVRPWWDIHRHRMAPAVGALVGSAIDRGQLVVAAGRLIAVEPSEISVSVQIRRRGSDRIEALDVARVINCAGSETNFAACREPLLRDLLARRLARPDPLGLGLEVCEQGGLLDEAGVPSRRLYAIGPVTRGTFWEIVAVPDIRLHCERLANHLAASLRTISVGQMPPTGLGAPVRATGTALRPPRRHREERNSSPAARSSSAS